MPLYFLETRQDVPPDICDGREQSGQKGAFPRYRSINLLIPNPQSPMVVTLRTFLKVFLDFFCINAVPFILRAFRTSPCEEIPS
jgi:hypothetical protein